MKTRKTDSKSKKTAQLDAAALLDCLPVKNERVTEDESTSGKTVLSVPLKKRWYLGRPFSLFLPVSNTRRVSLDKLGGEVWQACDGTTTNERIIERFAKKHNLTFHEARICVLEFMKMLVQRGFLVLAGIDSTGEEQTA